MRFLANENFPKPSIQLLRGSGLYIKSIQEENPGIKDNDVINIAQKENLIILTFDKDYGEIIFRHGIINPPSVIFFRDKGSSPLHAGQTLVRLLADVTIQFHNNFTIIEDSTIRQRKY